MNMSYASVVGSRQIAGGNSSAKYYRNADDAELVELDREVRARMICYDTDFVGLRAFELYRSHREAWRAAVRQQKGRAPTRAELLAFMLGEMTDRRINQYIVLASVELTADQHALSHRSALVTETESSFAPAHPVPKDATDRPKSAALSLGALFSFRSIMTRRETANGTRRWWFIGRSQPA